MLYWIGYILFTVFSRFFFPRTVIGLENIPARGSFIIACNHVSNLDPFIVGISLIRRVSFVAKEELFKKKFLGFVLAAWGAFPINRGSADFRALREALRRIKGGRPIVIFPEGTRRVDNSTQEPEQGVGFIARKSGVPVIPAFIDGSDKVLPPGKKFPQFHPVKLYFGRAVTYSSSDSYPAIAQRIMDSIYALPPQSEDV